MIIDDVKRLKTAIFLSFIIIVGLNLCTLAEGADSDVVLKVGMPVPGQVPFLWSDENGQIKGIYADTLRAVASEVDLEIVFLPLSQARLIRHFVAGEIDMEIGVSSKAKERSEIANLSIFSRPFGMANEVIIYTPKLRFPAFILKDLKGRKVAAVRGALTPEYIVRENFTSPLQIAKRVNRGWSEVGFMREAPAMHYKINKGMGYKISLPYESNPIRFRLHLKRSGLINKIDEAIDKISAEGRLEQIICNYLCGN